LRRTPGERGAPAKPGYPCAATRSTPADTGVGYYTRAASNWQRWYGGLPTGRSGASAHAYCIDSALLVPVLRLPVIARHGQDRSPQGREPVPSLRPPAVFSYAISRAARRRSRPCGGVVGCANYGPHALGDGRPGELDPERRHPAVGPLRARRARLPSRPRPTGSTSVSRLSDFRHCRERDRGRSSPRPQTPLPTYSLTISGRLRSGRAPRHRPRLPARAAISVHAPASQLAAADDPRARAALDARRLLADDGPPPPGAVPRRRPAPRPRRPRRTSPRTLRSAAAKGSRSASHDNKPRVCARWSGATCEATR